MHFFALATDYDGTLASDGVVAPSTVAALEKLRVSGRKVLLVTGRQLDDVLHAFPRAELFERIVAENGALLYNPRTRESRLLAEPVPEGLEAELRRRGVSPVSVGRSIIATLRPHERTVLAALADLGIDREIIFNNRAIMILPAGTNKVSGLMAVLGEMKILPSNVVAVGDAENDLPMLKQCGCGVAVGNALDSVKAGADLVTSRGYGAGVEELIAEIIENDLARCHARGGDRGLEPGTAKNNPR
jgi:hydroxymethylpyrimidine pyrophosphatase-like HAD family hydrolase